MSDATRPPADVRGRILRASTLPIDDEETMIAGLRAGAEAVERGELDVDDFVGVWSQYLRELFRRASSVPAPADVRERVAREVFTLDADWRREYWDQFRREFPRQAQAYYDTADRILALLRTPRGEGERVQGAWATVEAAALARADLLDSNFAGQRAQAAEIRNAVAHVAAFLRAPRGEGEAQPWRKVGEEPPPNGVQVLVYDPRPDGYSHAGCWAYTLIRKGDEYYLDGERCDEEDRSRLRIEEWLWQPLPPYPGSRSKDDGVRDAARRSEAQGEDRWEDLIFGTLIEAYNEAHAARRDGAQGEG